MQSEQRRRGVGIRGAVRESGGLALVVLTSLAFAWPLFDVHFLHSSDGFLHLYRALDFSQVLAAGILWPRVAPSLAFGHGYPAFDFYSPATYYLVAGLQTLGLNAAGR